MQKHMNVKPVAEDPAAPLTVTNIDPDNGQAHNLIYPGLSIRATMAMHIAAGLTASDTKAELDDYEIARRSVGIADALIVELQK